jgi:hypothetical protein
MNPFTSGCVCLLFNHIAMKAAVAETGAKHAPTHNLLLRLLITSAKHPS